MSQNSFLLNVRGVSYKPTVYFFKTNRAHPKFLGGNYL